MNGINIETGQSYTLVSGTEVSVGINIGAVGATGATGVVAATAPITYDAATRTVGSDGTITTQGNTFNGASELIQTTATGKYPALDGSLITNLSGGTLAGDVTGAAGSNTVAFVGTSSAANVHVGELLANAATNANTVSTIVKRDASGNFSAGTITATLSGTITGNIAESQVTGLTTDLSTLTNAIVAVNASAVHIAGTETVTGAKTFSATITGNVSGNAGTVTNGVYTTGAGTVFLAPNGSAAALTSFPTLNQNTTGSAGTLSPGRTINGVAFDGSTNVTVTAAAGTLSGSTLAAGVTASSLTSVGTLTGGAIGAGFTAIANSALANNSVTIVAGTNMSGGGTVALGGSVTLNATGGGGSGAPFAIVGNAQASTIAQSLTRFHSPFNPTAITSEVPGDRLIIPRNATAQNFRVFTANAPPSGQTFTFTVFLNGSAPASGLAATITSAGNTASDLINTITVAAGDGIDVQIITSATSGSTGAISWSLELVTR